MAALGIASSRIRRLASATLLASTAGLSLSWAGCSAGDVNSLKKRACNEIENLPMDQLRPIVEDAIAQLDRQGVSISIDVWNDPQLLADWIAQVEHLLGCDVSQSSGGLGRVQQALPTGTNYCGPGHDGLCPTVSPCLNEACRQHDACYSRCSEPTSLACLWSSTTSPCDEQFFATADSCNYVYGTKIRSALVIAAAHTLANVGGRDSGCAAGMQCSPATNVFGPCSKNRASTTCKQCLARVDPGGACLTSSCPDDPTDDICYAATCGVSECFGWSKVQTPPPPPPSQCTPACKTGYLCSAGACVLDPAGKYAVTITRASASAADGDGTPPEPRVCLNYNGTDYCTSPDYESYTPSWYYTLPVPISGAALRKGIAFNYLEIDAVFDDTICTGTVVLTDPLIAAGGFRQDCGTTGNDWFEAMLTPQ